MVLVMVEFSGGSSSARCLRIYSCHEYQVTYNRKKKYYNNIIILNRASVWLRHTLLEDRTSTVPTLLQNSALFCRDL